MYDIAVLTAFGVESIAAGELRHLGYKGFSTENGRIMLSGSAYDIAALNYNLRSADRVQVRLAHFDAIDFDQLYDGVQSVAWGDMLPQNGFIQVLVKTAKSKINSVRAAQSIAKKAIIETLKKKYKQETFPEDGARFQIIIDIKNDKADLLLDASGAGLHKRGYRLQSGEAPLRETTAAAMLLASRWFGRDKFWDPFCGSGTIAIEAAMIAASIPPGLKREFAFADWSFLDQNAIQEARAKAEEMANSLPDRMPEIRASDNDPRAISAADANMERAGVQKMIKLFKADATALKNPGGPGLMMGNPPYGERLGEVEEAEKLYQQFGEAMKQFPDWECALLTSNKFIERFYGRRYNKNRKLYNGKIQCYLYSWPAEKR